MNLIKLIQNNSIIIISLLSSLIVVCILMYIYWELPKLQIIDMNLWLYKKKYNYYYQNDIIYYNNLIDITKATLSIYYPESLMDCTNKYKYYKCTYNEKNNNNNNKIAFFLLNTTEYIPDISIKKFTDNDIIIIKPNFHHPYNYYDIILTITEIKASIRYIFSNLINPEIYVIGYGIYGEIANILGASMNSTLFDDNLDYLDCEKKNDEKINGIISYFPLGGFDIQNSAYIWLFNYKNKIYNNIISQHYEKYLNENIFSINDNKKGNLINDYYSNLSQQYDLKNEISTIINDFPPIYDDSDENKKQENKLFGNYYDKKPQHFDYFFYGNLFENQFSFRNNYGKNLNITERVNMTSPNFYLKNLTNPNKDSLPNSWIIYSKKINPKNYTYFPTEFNLYYKINYISFFVKEPPIIFSKYYFLFNCTLCFLKNETNDCDPNCLK